MLLNACCCGDSNDNTQANFQPNSERVPYAECSGTSENASAPDFCRMDPAATKQAQKGTVTSGDASAGRDKAEERARLQERVQTFAKRASRGIEASLWNPQTRQWLPMSYTLGKGLKELIVQVEGRSDEVCQISKLRDILRVEDDESSIPVEMTATINEESKRRMLLVQYPGKNLYILEKSIEDAEIFFSSMRVVRLYCQQLEKGK
mmetsp:Transcript_84179/g.146187  ORF Transcript_84179/g.146187 Transcript_84179/m.146187 type:complete len:206 (-) Transcript_84179:69-686(-)